MSFINNNRGESCSVQQPKRHRIHSAHHQWQKQQWENIMKAKEDPASTTGQTSLWTLVNQAQQKWPNAKGLQDCDLSSSPDSNSVLSMSHRKAAMVPTSPHSRVAAGGPPPNPHVQNTERPTVVSLSNLRYMMRIAASTFERTPSIFRKRTRDGFSSKVSGENNTYSQGGGYLHKDNTTTVQNPSEGPPKLSIVPSEGFAKELSISAVEILNGSASTPSYQGASRGVSSSTHATLSRASSKNVSRFDCATPSTVASKKASPSSSGNPSTAAAKVSPSSIAPSTTASVKSLHSSSATPSRPSKKVSPSSSAAASRQMSTQALETLLQQKIRPSHVSQQLFDQNKGTPKQKGLASNQTRSLSQSERSSDVDARLPAPVGNIKSSFKGVGYFKRTKRWEAHIWNTEISKQEYLGAFYSEEQAARAYDRATLYFRGVSTKLHLKLEDYAEELPRLQALTKDQLTTMLKKQSKGRGRLNPAYPA